MLRLLSLVALALLASTSAYGDVYKWVDTDGKVHYSNQPPYAQTGSNNIAPRAVAARDLTLKEAVAACVVIVRQETDNQYGFKISSWDAYVKSDGRTVSSFGTKQEKFLFDKCMTEKGQPGQPLE